MTLRERIGIDLGRRLPVEDGIAWAQSNNVRDAIDSPSLGWSFTVNHATLVPEGIDGFIDGMPMDRCEEVRLADNHGEYELHMFPGEGIIDFGSMFRRIEGAGFSGHYTNAFGNLDDCLRGRDVLVEMAAAAGVTGAGD